MEVLQKRPSQVEFIMKTEMAYYSSIHKNDKMQRPELYRQNGICHDEKLENLLILLETSSTTNEALTATVANLPSNKDVLTSLSNSSKPQATHDNKNTISLSINQLCVVIWQKGKRQGYDWYIAYVKSIDEKIILDHLCREKPGSNKWWRYPAQTDV